MGSLGDEIAAVLSRKLGWRIMTRETVLTQFFQPFVNAQDLHLLRESARFYLTSHPIHGTYKGMLEHALRDTLAIEPAIIVGCGAQAVLANSPDVLHLRIVAPRAVRIERVVRRYGIGPEEAARLVQTADKKHQRFVSTVFALDSADTLHYHLSLNTAELDTEACALAIITLYEEQQMRRHRQLELDRQTRLELQQPTAGRPVFKNESEAEFARILDMYQIDWVYEPRTFPVEWDADGNVTLAFSPDFYLTRFDTYIELTTMNQKYVTTKNKKVKKLRELYPGINIRIVYKKDFQSLIDRFSLR
jgi:hypothetical protein